MKRKFNEISTIFTVDINDKCPICMDKLKNTNLTITKCGHKFCHSCLDLHSCNDNKCPMCRTNMGTNTKIKICDCDINHSVTKALDESAPNLNNLGKLITKKFMESISDLDLYEILNENKNTFLTHEVINNIKRKITSTLNQDNDFKISILKYLVIEIGYFSKVNSNYACHNLKDISDTN